MEIGNLKMRNCGASRKLVTEFEESGYKLCFFSQAARTMQQQLNQARSGLAPPAGNVPPQPQDINPSGVPSERL
jgi:hypothetical protein